VTADTSVIVPALVSWHVDHDRCRRALSDVVAVAAHAELEAYSVLTRLPPPRRMPARAVAEALAETFPGDRLTLGDRNRAALVGVLAERDIGGGRVYDALIGLTAEEHELQLLTRDRRAMKTYAALEIPHVVI